VEEMKTSKILRRSIAVLMVLVLVLALAACGGKKEGGVIKFASVAPMTGDGAAMGRQQKLGVEIAMEEVNAAGGVNGNTFKFDVYDDQGLPNQALIAAQKIVSDKEVRFVVGHINSGCSLAALPTYAENNLPLVSGTNTAPSMTQQGYKNYFRTMQDDNAIIGQDTLFAIKELGYSKIAVMYENTDYGKGGRDAAMATLAENGLEAYADLSYVPSTDRDFSAQITTIKASGADAVLFVGEYTAASIFLKQRASLGLEAAMVGGSSCMNPKIIEIAGADAEGMYTLSPFDPNSTDEMVVTFMKKYSEKSGGEMAGEWSSHNYDSFMAYANALKTLKAEFTQEELINALHNMDAFKGVTGTIKFDEKGDVTGKILKYFFVKDGKFESYTPTKLG